MLKLNCGPKWDGKKRDRNCLPHSLSLWFLQTFRMVGGSVKGKGLTGANWWQHCLRARQCLPVLANTNTMPASAYHPRIHPPTFLHVPPRMYADRNTTQEYKYEYNYKYKYKYSACQKHSSSHLPSRVTTRVWAVPMSPSSPMMLARVKSTSRYS